MKRLFLLFAALICTATAQSPRIVGGSPAPQGAFPWMTAVVYKHVADNFQGQFAGAALIHPRWVLTACHIVDGEKAADIQVIVGAEDLDAAGLQRINVLEIIRHPQWLPTGFDNDVALLLLETPVTTVEPLEIISNPALSAAGTVATTMGWGSYSEAENDFGGPLLYSVEVPIVDQTLANSLEYHNGDLTPNMLAAGEAAGGKDTCRGDSGGPLVVQGDRGQWVQAGIVSWGDGCAQPMKPGVYTRVSKYRQWIQSYIWPNYHTWEVARGLTTDDGPDTDGDGASLWLEYALRRDPLRADSPGFSAAGLLTPPGQTLPTLSLRRPAGGGDLAWGLQHSTTLQAWTALDAAAQQIGTPVPVPGDAGAEQITWSGPGGTPSSFLRASIQPGGAYYNTVRPLRFPGGVTHALHLDDTLTSGFRERDYLLANLPTSQAVTITLRSTDFDAVLQVVNADTGAVISTSSGNIGGGNDERIALTADPALRYYARVTTQTAGATGEFTLALFQLDTTRPVITGNQLANGSLLSSDPTDPFFPGSNYYIDDFRFTAVTGSPVTVYLTSATFDPDLSIISAETGERLHSSVGLRSGNGFAHSALQTFIPRPGAAYYIRASSGAPGATGNYTLRTTATLLAGIPSTISGNLSITDGVDPYWIPNYTIQCDDFVLDSPPPGVLRTVSVNSTVLDTTIEILDAASGATVAYNDDIEDGDTNSSVSFTPLPGHAYIIRVSEYDPDTTGAYTLFVQ